MKPTVKSVKPGGTLNTFNKKTGKFEKNGGWVQRKNKNDLRTDLDEHNRPVQHIALLCVKITLKNEMTY
jgi:hypothetical protein